MFKGGNPCLHINRTLVDQRKVMVAQQEVLTVCVENKLPGWSQAV